MATAYQEKKDFEHAASKVGEQAQEIASDAESKAQDLASTVSQKVGEAASMVGKKAEDAASAMGAGIKSFGGTIRDYAPQTGVAGSAASAVAGSLESGGRYLQEHGLSGIGADLATVIRRNPIPALAVGIGAGFLLACAMSRRSV